MNKKLLLATVVAVGMTSGVQAATDLKLATVNILDIMRESEEGKKVTGELEKKRKELTERIQKSEQKLTAELNTFKEKASILDEAAREKEEARLMKERRNLENLVQTSEDELKHMMQNASDRLTSKAQAVIEKHAQANGYDIIMDVASGRVVYHRSEKTDLTHIMLADMNTAYKKENSDKKPAVQVATKKDAPKPAAAA
jgi:outer membrane protein